MSIPSYRSPNFGNKFPIFSKGSSNSKLLPLNWHDSAKLQNAGGLDVKQALLIGGGLVFSAAAVTAMAYLAKSKPSVKVTLPIVPPVETTKKPVTPPPPAWNTSALPVFAADFLEKIEAAEKALHDKDGKLPDKHKRAGYAYIETHTHPEFTVKLSPLTKVAELTPDFVNSLLESADLRTKLFAIHQIVANKNLRKEIATITYPIRDPKVAGNTEILIGLKNGTVLSIPLTDKEWNFTTSDQWKKHQYRLLPAEIEKEFQLSAPLAPDAHTVIYEHKQPYGIRYRLGVGSGY